MPTPLHFFQKQRVKRKLGSGDEQVKERVIASNSALQLASGPKSVRLLVFLGLVILLASEGQSELPRVTNNTWHLSICQASSYPRWKVTRCTPTEHYLSLRNMLQAESQAITGSRLRRLLLIIPRGSQPL